MNMSTNNNKSTYKSVDEMLKEINASLNQRHNNNNNNNNTTTTTTTNNNNNDNNDTQSLDVSSLATKYRDIDEISSLSSSKVALSPRSKQFDDDTSYAELVKNWTLQKEVYERKVNDLEKALDASLEMPVNTSVINSDNQHFKAELHTLQSNLDQMKLTTDEKVANISQKQVFKDREAYTIKSTNERLKMMIGELKSELRVKEQLYQDALSLKDEVEEKSKKDKDEFRKKIITLETEKGELEETNRVLRSELNELSSKYANQVSGNGYTQQINKLKQENSRLREREINLLNQLKQHSSLLTANTRTHTSINNNNNNNEFQWLKQNILGLKSEVLNRFDMLENELFNTNNNHMGWKSKRSSSPNKIMKSPENKINSPSKSVISPELKSFDPNMLEPFNLELEEKKGKFSSANLDVSREKRKSVDQRHNFELMDEQKSIPPNKKHRDVHESSYISEVPPHEMETKASKRITQMPNVTFHGQKSKLEENIHTLEEMNKSLKQNSYDTTNYSMNSSKIFNTSDWSKAANKSNFDKEISVVLSQYDTIHRPSPQKRSYKSKTRTRVPSAVSSNRNHRARSSSVRTKSSSRVRKSSGMNPKTVVNISTVSGKFKKSNTTKPKVRRRTLTAPTASSRAKRKY